MNTVLENITAESVGMDYDIVPRELSYNFNGDTKTYGNRVAFIRSDNGYPLSVMSKRAKIHQPRAVLDFFKRLCRTYGLRLTKAGIVGNGERYYSLAEIDADSRIINGNEHKSFVLIATACDGSLATVLRITDMCMWCTNMLSAMSRQPGEGVIKVSHRVDFNPEKVILNFDELHGQWESFSEKMSALADVRNITDEQARKFYTELLSPNRKEDSHRAVRGLDNLMSIYKNAPAADAGSAYGLVQGMTRFIDHERGTEKSRLKSALFGQGNNLKTAAFEKAFELVS